MPTIYILAKMNVTHCPLTHTPPSNSSPLLHKKSCSTTLIVGAGTGVTAQTDDEEEREKHRDELNHSDRDSRGASNVQILLHIVDNEGAAGGPWLVHMRSAVDYAVGARLNRIQISIACPSTAINSVTVVLTKEKALQEVALSVRSAVPSLLERYLRVVSVRESTTTDTNQANKEDEHENCEEDKAN